MPRQICRKKPRPLVTQWGLDPLWEAGEKIRISPGKLLKQSGSQLKQTIRPPKVLRPRGIPEEAEEEATSRGIAAANLQAAEGSNGKAIWSGNIEIPRLPIFAMRWLFDMIWELEKRRVLA